MRKKLAVLFLGAALTVSMLGACGGKDAASSSASAVSASSAADASSASVQDASKAESSTSTSDVSAESASAAETAGESSASELEDGTYTADFNTDSNMFHVNEAKEGKGVLTVKDGKAVLIKVDMGRPELKPERIPIVSGGDAVISEPIVVDGAIYRMTGVSMGNPHAVIFVDDVKGLELEAVGPKFENHERFPKRVNTEFARVIDRETVEMRVWERGSGETLACGTGACAVAVACILNGLTEDKVTVRLLGGDLLIEWDKEADKVYMTGPAEVVFDGEIQI